jgi:hypothetical protein
MKFPIKALFNIQNFRNTNLSSPIGQGLCVYNALFLYLYETFLPIYIPIPLPQYLHTSKIVLEKLMVDGKEMLSLFLQPFLY